MRRRSQLYVPANSEKMIRKSTELPADSIIFDLEDAVPTPEKERAKTLLLQLLDNLTWGKRELCVRINGLSSPWGTKDLFDMRQEKIDAIVVPKAEKDLSFVKRAYGKGVIPLIESPMGLVNVEEITRAEGVEAVSYGIGDLAAAMGGDISAYENNIFVKTTIVTVAKAYGVEAIDKVFFDLKDVAAFESEAVEAKKLGFTGKQVIHPDQVKIANEVYSPSGEEITWSRRVLAAYEDATKSGKGATTLDSKLVDAVHYRMAKRILENAGE